GGYPVDLPSWRSFAETKGIFLIEDAAHAPAMRNVGRWSNASVFSFFTNKNMTTAEGGMVLTREKTLLERIQRLRSHGMTTLTLDRYRGHAYSYDVTMLGYNYRMDELRAAIGLVQLTHLRKWNAKRIDLSILYRNLISNCLPEVKIPFSQTHSTSAHLMPIILPPSLSRQEVMDQLREAGIQSSIHYPPVHLFSYYRKKFPGVFLPRTEAYCAKQLTLPLHPFLTEDEVKYIVESLYKIIKNLLK
ncbi:DegT/DnrJ/EryC1/StrS aminotransferase family protein, partial [bacterium]|nr:DegT/DnrJ/EryC1/StrS aminotransferase family protein [bacterium]